MEGSVWRVEAMGEVESAVGAENGIGDTRWLSGNRFNERWRLVIGSCMFTSIRARVVFS